MSDTEMAATGPVCVLLAIPLGRNGWAKKDAMLHYEAGRLIKAEGMDLIQTGSMGLTGTLYVVKESLSRFNRLVMRIERQKFVNGKVVDVKNWGEIEDAVPRAA